MEQEPPEGATVPQLLVCVKPVLVTMLEMVKGSVPRSTTVRGTVPGRMVDPGRGAAKVAWEGKTAAAAPELGEIFRMKASDDVQPFGSVQSWMKRGWRALKTGKSSVELSPSWGVVQPRT